MTILVDVHTFDKRRIKEHQDSVVLRALDKTLHPNGKVAGLRRDTGHGNR